MTKSNKVSFLDALSEKKIKRLTSKLSGLPTHSRFKEKVEQDIWETFVGQENQEEDVVKYNSLPEISKSIIGYIESEEGETKKPWWFTWFNWEATSRGETINLIGQFENFDPKTTKIHKPEFSDDGFLKTLKSFKRVQEELEKHIDIEDGQTQLDIPDNIFKISKNKIETTGEFEEWFNNLLQLCPPINESFTVLFVANNNVSWESTDGILSKETVKRLKDLGFDDTKVYNETYYKNLNKVLLLSGVFDLTVPQEEKYDDLNPLESLLYETWVKNNQDKKEDLKNWIKNVSSSEPDKLEAGEESNFVSDLFNAPFRIDRSKPIYITLSVYAPGSDGSGYYKSNWGKRREINQIFKSYGFVE